MGVRLSADARFATFFRHSVLKGHNAAMVNTSKGWNAPSSYFYILVFLIPKSCTKFMIEILHFYALPPAGGRELLPQVLLFIALTCLLPSSAHPSQVGELWGKGVRMEEEAVKWEFLHSRVSLHLWMLLVIVFDYLLVLLLESVLRTEHLYENQSIALTLAHYQIFLFISEHYTALEARN